MKLYCVFHIFVLNVYSVSLCRAYIFGGSGTTVIAGIASLGTFFYTNFDKLRCAFGDDCCPVKYGKNGWIGGLKDDLSLKLHGQHLVKQIVGNALESHFQNKEPAKALVLSFHGWTGSGKNFVSRIIAEHIFKKGMKSKFVHLFLSTIQFPHEDKVDIYKLQIQDWIRGNVSQCEMSLFIFDEIDKMPTKMIDAIKPFIDYHDNVFGVDFRKSIFIFLSNTGGRDIVKKTTSFWQEGKKRTDITYTDMEELMEHGAFNENGGLHESGLIHHSLIDFYVPFLPMERQHIELCIQDELIRRGVEPSNAIVSAILNGVMFFPPEKPLYAKKGCKGIESKVGYFLTEKQFAKGEL